jgi:hypothetical protein
LKSLACAGVGMAISDIAFCCKNAQTKGASKVNVTEITCVCQPQRRLRPRVTNLWSQATPENRLRARPAFQRSPREVLASVDERQVREESEALLQQP